MFNMIPVIVSRNHKLNMGSRLLMGVIISLNRGELGCIAKNKYLADELGVSLSSIKRYLVELKDSGYIDIGTIPRENFKDIRTIVPTKEILLGIKTATKNVTAYDKKKNRKAYEPDWLKEIMDEF